MFEQLAASVCITNTTNIELTPTDELIEERSKYKAIAEEVDQTFADLSGY